MNERQRKFCDCYLANGLNATAAYKEAGYKTKSDEAAKVCACKLLTNANVQDYLAEHSKALQEKAEAEHEERLMTAEELAMFFCNVANGKEKDGDEPAKMSDRLKAGELYGKYLNMFSTNVNVKTSEPIVIHNNVTE